MSTHYKPLIYGMRHHDNIIVHSLKKDDEPGVVQAGVVVLYPNMCFIVNY